MAKKLPKGKSLAEVNPELAKQWHSTKNGDLTPFDFTNKSGVKVWWKCDKGDDHEWFTRIAKRSYGGQCPICSGRQLALSNCLATVNPKVAKEWHPTKNGDLTPYEVTSASGKRVWWKCDKGDDHEWESIIMTRNNGASCAMCSSKKIAKSNCLATLNPTLAKEWHSTKNGDLTPFDVFVSSSKKVWWKCDKGDDHEWEQIVAYRNTGAGCPMCSGHRLVLSNCLATTHPELSKEWHPTKNGDLTPFEISSSSPKIVWWKCPKGNKHEWVASPSSRKYHNTGCGVCSGRTIVKSNCLATTHPELSEEWHPTKNGDLTPYNYSFGSHKKIWWKCPKGDDHEWNADINNRNRTECPFCTLTPQSKQELTITFELIRFFKDINPKGFKTRVKGKLWSIDIYIPQLKLGIEFDGSYWHKDKRALDKLKTEHLEEEGFEIFRVREEPLKRIFDDDIMSKQPFNAKQVTNDILAQIMKMYELDTKKIAKIQSYIAKKELQNEKGLDKYIEMILTEKAEKKN
jgi:very-short-patch-repair endonuclease